MNRILIIRGGALGDFILTLPALKSVRDAYSEAHIEILGYAHIAALADRRFYANAVRSIEYGALSRFFARGSELSSDLSEYFAGFDLIISYLFDPDLIFQTNLERTGVRDIVVGPSKITEGAHAAQQLAEPMVADLGLSLHGTGALLYPSAEDRAFAADFLADLPAPIFAFHPGSGSERKNWPLPRWIELGSGLLDSREFTGSILVVTGEADRAQSVALQPVWNGPRVRFASNLPLPHLAAVLASTHFIGHDSGVSHLAAATGADCLLLFGPTNPDVWAPSNQNVRVLRAPNGDLNQLPLDSVLAELPL